MSDINMLIPSLPASSHRAFPHYQCPRLHFISGTNKHAYRTIYTAGIISNTLYCTWCTPPRLLMTSKLNRQHNIWRLWSYWKWKWSSSLGLGRCFRLRRRWSRFFGSYPNTEECSEVLPILKSLKKETQELLNEEIEELNEQENNNEEGEITNYWSFI